MVPQAVAALKTDDGALRLVFDRLKILLFNEPTTAMKETVLQAAIAKARADVGAG